MLDAEGRLDARARQVGGTTECTVFQRALDLLERQPDALIFGTPTYMGGVSAPFKTFMDASAKVWFVQGWKDKLAAGFTHSGSQNGDKFNTVTQLFTFAMQHGMIWAGLGLMPGNNTSKGSNSDLNRLGGFSGALTQSNNDQGAEAIPASDLKTAEALGARVAAVALRLAREQESVAA